MTCVGARGCSGFRTLANARDFARASACLCTCMCQAEDDRSRGKAGRFAKSTATPRPRPSLAPSLASLRRPVHSVSLDDAACTAPAASNPDMHAAMVSRASRHAARHGAYARPSCRSFDTSARGALGLLASMDVPQWHARSTAANVRPPTARKHAADDMQHAADDASRTVILNHVLYPYSSFAYPYSSFAHPDSLFAYTYSSSAFT